MGRSTTNKGQLKPTSKAAKKAKAAPKGNVKKIAALNVQVKNTSQKTQGHKRQAPKSSEERSSDEDPVPKTQSQKKAKQAEAKPEQGHDTEENVEEDNDDEVEGEPGSDITPVMTRLRNNLRNRDMRYETCLKG
jgi:hypothetical protein